MLSCTIYDPSDRAAARCSSEGFACICASRGIGANRGIHQCAHWFMHRPPACAIYIRIPAGHQKNTALWRCFFSAPAGIRTPDTLLKRQVLCLLSYWGVSSEQAADRLASVKHHESSLPPLLLLSKSNPLSLGFDFVTGEKCRSSQIGAQRSGSDLVKEEGSCGYGVFAALTQTAETEWSSFLLTWLGWRDSNPLYRSQSPVCYHYTTSHRDEQARPALPAPVVFVGWDMGLEPTTPGTTIRCSAN